MVDVDMGGENLIVQDIKVGATGPGQQGTDLDVTHLAYVGGVTPGTVTASKAVVVDSSSNITGFNNITMTGLLTESAADALTAHAGGGQGSALALTKEVNRITTVATAGDSVKLPASAAGLSIILINSGANSMQVYGNGTDTINGVASATGVAQMNNSIVLYSCSVAGSWFAEGIGCGFSGSLPTQSFTNGLTAHAGGGQGSATALTASMNRVTTVASANDSVVLPASAPGLVITVANAAAANSMNVFPASGESINALSANTAFAVAANKAASFYCFNTGVWHSILTA